MNLKIISKLSDNLLFVDDSNGQINFTKIHLAGNIQLINRSSVDQDLNLIMREIKDADPKFKLSLKNVKIEFLYKNTGTIMAVYISRDGHFGQLSPDWNSYNSTLPCIMIDQNNRLYYNQALNRELTTPWNFVVSLNHNTL